MKDEIKEILRYLRIENGHCSSELSYEETHILLDYITNLQDRITELETINEEHRKLNGELREENKELKMTNLALADDITKNKIIKQEALTECCGIPIGEIPMLKIQNDEYKTRIDRAIEYIDDNTYYKDHKGHINIDDLYVILQGDEENE